MERQKTKSDLYASLIENNFRVFTNGKITLGKFERTKSTHVLNQDVSELLFISLKNKRRNISNQNQMSFHKNFNEYYV
jgi:hypothetical protein